LHPQTPGKRLKRLPLMSIRDLGLCFLLLALPGCGSEPRANSPDGSVGGAVTDVQRLFPLEHDTVFSYVTTDEAGTSGIYVMEISRPRSTMAELKVASKVDAGGRLRLALAPDRRRRMAG
jgi:hypothetical protein